MLFRSMAKYYLPLIASIIKNNEFIFFDDYDNEKLYDVYIENTDKIIIDIEEIKCRNYILDEINMCSKEFSEIAKDIQGEKLCNLNAFIRYKYEENGTE